MFFLIFLDLFYKFLAKKKIRIFVQISSISSSKIMFFLQLEFLLLPVGYLVNNLENIYYADLAFLSGSITIVIKHKLSMYVYQERQRILPQLCKNNVFFFTFFYFN